MIWKHEAWNAVPEIAYIDNILIDAAYLRIDLTYMQMILSACVWKLNRTQWCH
jgi:hypothetical protein